MLPELRLRLRAPPAVVFTVPSPILGACSDHPHTLSFFTVYVNTFDTLLPFMGIKIFPGTVLPKKGIFNLNHFSGTTPNVLFFFPLPFSNLRT